MLGIVYRSWGSGPELSLFFYGAYSQVCGVVAGVISRAYVNNS